MPLQYRAIATVSPSQSNDAYIYTIEPTTGNGLAAITSANELLLVDRQTLSTSNILRLEGAPQGLSCLVRGDPDGNTVLCSGTDGAVSTFDVRSQSRVSQFKIDRAISAMACRGFHVAVGTELAPHHTSVIAVWDRRHNKQLWQNAENNDDITALDFHPSKSNILLSGGDDGLVSVFDTNIPEEDDSLIQAINHGPIHKAGFLGESRLFALSSDQNLAFHPFSSPDDNHDPEPTLVGDLRPLIPCEYVINLLRSEAGCEIIAGSNINDPRVDIVDVRDALRMDAEPKLDRTPKRTLEGGHGEEVVRSIYIENENGTIFTAGEDGQIKAWQATSNASTPLKEDRSKKSSGRYKPY